MDTLTNLALAVAVIAVVLFVGKQLLAPIESVKLQRKFIGLGNMTGKSLDEIKSIAGEPSISEAFEDGMAYTWSSPKYAIKLKFINSKCVGKLGEKAIK